MYPNLTEQHEEIIEKMPLSPTERLEVLSYINYVVAAQKDFFSIHEKYARKLKYNWQSLIEDLPYQYSFPAIGNPNIQTYVDIYISDKGDGFSIRFEIENFCYTLSFGTTDEFSGICNMEPVV